jgi:cellulose synthase/poly-beta-1,6-N-acetylglucosamine synthase-like glycosyltransferase
MAEFCFWFSVASLCYPFFGYPAILSLLARLAGKRAAPAEAEPTVTLVITAHNERHHIREKLEETLALDYPSHKLEIIVASDGSTDGTDEIVQEFRGRGVLLHRVEGRAGKTLTQNAAVEAAHGDAVVFSDATSRYRPDVIQKLVRNYHDPDIGAVTGRTEFANPSGSGVGAGAVLLWKHEDLVKSAEARIWSVLGCSGCIYSVRRELYHPLGGDLSEDFVQALKTIEKGYRVAYEREAVAREDTTERARDEFRRRVRTFNRGMSGMAAMKHLLNPIRHPFLSFALLSHKVLRWLAPLFAIVALLSTCLLRDNAFYGAMLWMQVLVLALGLLGVLIGDGSSRLGRALSLPTYVVVVGTALLVSQARFLLGKDDTVWEPAR